MRTNSCSDEILFLLIKHWLIIYTNSCGSIVQKHPSCYYLHKWESFLCFKSAAFWVRLDGKFPRMWINQKKMSYVQLRVELLMCLSQRKNWAWTQCETQHLPGLRHPNKDKNSNLHVIRDAPTELWNAPASGGSLGPVTQLRTGTSSTTSASGSSTDMMPINETAKSTNETGIEILCQTVLRRLHLQADVRWQRQVWTGEEMDTWQTTVWSNFIKRKKKSVFKRWKRREKESHRKPQRIFLKQTLRDIFGANFTVWWRTLVFLLRSTVQWWRSQCGVPFLLSSRVCRPSCRPSACWVPTLWAISVAVMSIWAYLVELFPVQR